ncbi:hypothetical protein NIES37_32050 [Tolypothrix tenuis PCC 7101]|uniref:DUF5331 domain-containing protein n=1 Tax=Tolypothrix tenuis PCC 7101 TaxID=231146 RepID=A0A1Z4N0G2_9CYAN|nr:hypothetical protein [Aulosira sp. FACHB-113]BAY99226.1 hypothetical protein NIES37_32050 [Tolypothrix tenuis PCC 7101]BAZ76851.1 hypothetical protein NIES50_54530 [Aulosira laxa NIES-50]
MNIQQLRQSLKMKWLSYYQQNRPWLVKMRIWATYDGLRRPSSGFMLATLSVLEPEFDQILDFIMELNNNPDEIIRALGLNFNPDKELDLINKEDAIVADQFSAEPLAEIQDKLQPVLLATENLAVTSESPTRVFNSEPFLSDRTPTNIAVPSFTTNSVVRDRQPESSVAVATAVSGESNATTLVAEKPTDEILPEQQPERSQLQPTYLSVNEKTLQSLGVTIKRPSNGKSLKVQLPPIPKKVKLSHPSNATTVSSWVDEFCQGADWNPEEAIFIHF